LILILTTTPHRYTHQELETEHDVDVRVITYTDLLDAGRRVPATYIFTDLDRLPFWVLIQVARLFGTLKRQGFRVLNDPARVLGRYGLLRALNREGINSFDAYRVESLELPRKWPVFLRMEGDHKAPISGLIDDEEQLDESVDALVAQGFPRAAMLIVEYAAEPVQPGLFRKLSAFRIGDRLIGGHCVHDDQWIVKYGKPAIAPPALYEEEYHFIAENPFSDVVAKAFETGAIDYGRVDFGLIGGKPQIYEINTNPDMKLRPEPSTVARRNESTDLFRSNYLDALRAIDTPTTKEAERAFPRRSEAN
jgi:hypothetical protein